VDEDAPGPPGPPVAPPPGWYQDPGSSVPRWWDGTGWGPVAPPAPPRNPGQNTALAVLGHLGVFMFPVVLPLVLYLTVGKDDADVRSHAREAANFQITFLIVWLTGSVVMFASSFASMWAGDDFPVAFAVLFPTMFLLYFVAIGLSVYGAVQAGRRREWRYPVNLRLVGRNDDAAA
jgi:uncharacterized protein